MMITDILYYLTIRPLEILFETIFFISYRFIGKPFATIIALSIFVNILVFPLYKRADKLQSEQRAREKAMEEKLSHIKKTFKGDEKVMMTQAYYRISGYKPVYALRGASSLLLQIPFFIAAYRFLSNLEMIKGMPSIMIPPSLNSGVPSYLIRDLGAPDAMFSAGGIAINVLPILMTLINIISGTVYSKGHLRKEKIQLYVTALVFLVLLYNSPAGLVMYWTCNNIFSLLKNAVQKMFEKTSLKTQLPANKAECPGSRDSADNRICDHLFLISAVLMAFMTGLFIPSNVLVSSASEFISPVNVFNPSLYLVYSLSLAFGFFVIWIGIYYLFSTYKVRKIFSCVMMAVCGCAVLDYMMFGSGHGTISADLKYDTAPVFGLKSILINLAVIILTAGVISLLFKYKPAICRVILLSGCAAFLFATCINIYSITGDYSDYKELLASSEVYDLMPEITLSKTGRNVVVLMLDRALGPTLLYSIYERPDLIEKYDGFTFYHDTVSYGSTTNVASPCVFGGYEYTPYEINKKDTELLVDKTNEALKVLPVLFSENGYGVTVMDPPYAGYSTPPDLSIYDDHPEIRKYISQNKYAEDSGEVFEYSLENRKRNLFYFGIVKSVPLSLQGVLYDGGKYNSEASSSADEVNTGDGNDDVSLNELEKQNDGYLVFDGINSDFMGWYPVLENLKDITNVNENEKGEFLMMYNGTTHEPTILQMPDYTPSLHVDNTLYYYPDLYTLNGVTMNLDSVNRVAHYHVNMAALLRVGEWLDYLKEQGVYDNTRIIITSDHGRSLGLFDGFRIGKDDDFGEIYLPLLMMKDFDSHGFNVSTDFMTNADACIFAVSGDVVEEAVNPFTGNPLDGHQKYEDIVRISGSKNWSIGENNGTVFEPSDWYTVNGSPYDVNSWSYLGFE